MSFLSGCVKCLLVYVDLQIPLQSFLQMIKHLIVHQHPLIAKHAVLVGYITKRLLLHLVSEQDSCLVRALSCSLQFSKLGIMSKDVHVTELMIEFMHTISFDHCVLMDMIIDNDSKFDDFFEGFIAYLSEEVNFQALVNLCEKRDLTESLMKEAMSTNKTSLVEYSSSESDSEDNVSSMSATYTRFVTLIDKLKVSFTKLTDSELVCKSKLVKINKIISKLNYF